MSRLTDTPILSRIRFREAGPLFGLILIGAVFAWQSDTFLTTPNLINILQQSAINACIALGMTLVISSGGTPIFGLPDGFRALTNGAVLGVPNPVIAVGVLAGLAWVILNKTPLGEYFMAVGGNPEAARIAGVPVTLTKRMACMMSGLTAAVAAMILIGRLGAAGPTPGTLWELDAIAAAAIGGASLMGGRGSIVGTLTAAKRDEAWVTRARSAHRSGCGCQA